MDPQILKSRRLKEVVEISQSMLEGDYEKLRTNRMISVENYKMASILTHTDIKEEDLPEGNEINMCKAMDQLFQRMRDEEKNVWNGNCGNRGSNMYGGSSIWRGCNNN